MGEPCGHGYPDNCETATGDGSPGIQGGRTGVPACVLDCMLMLMYHKGHTDTTQVYSVTVMTHVKALQAGHSSQGTSEPITPADTADPD